MTISITDLSRTLGPAAPPTPLHARTGRLQACAAHLLCLIGVLVCGLLAGPVAQAEQGRPLVNPPKAYYLALGDSLAYGMQQAKFNSEYPNIEPANFDTGYVDDLATKLERLSEGIQVTNLGCPGESSDSLIAGGPSAGRCGTGEGFPFAWLHRPYTTGTQLGDALAFLAAHARQTSPVTIDIGAVDLQATQRECAISNGTNTLAFLQCLQTQEPLTIAHVAGNLATILGHLRAVAPSAGLIVVGLYNAQFKLPGADELIEDGFNATMARVAAHFGAAFADPFAAINHGAAYPDEQASVCSQIAICTPLRDIHPFDNGYAVIGETIFSAAEYGALN